MINFTLIFIYNKRGNWSNDGNYGLIHPRQILLAISYYKSSIKQVETIKGFRVTNQNEL